MADYVKCPRCDLNYKLMYEDYCTVCKAVIENKSEPDADSVYEEKLQAKLDAYKANKESYEDFRAMRFNLKHVKRRN